MADTKVLFKRDADPNRVPIADGQLVYNTVTGESYEDVGNKRIQVGVGGDKLREIETSLKSKVTQTDINNAVKDKIDKNGHAKNAYLGTNANGAVIDKYLPIDKTLSKEGEIAEAEEVGRRTTWNSDLNTKVKFIQTRTELLSGIPIVDGQLVYDIVTGDVYEDLNNKRVLTSTNVFVAEYGVTSYQDIQTALDAKKRVQVIHGGIPFELCGKWGDFIYFANIQNHSDSKPSLIVRMVGVNNSNEWSRKKDLDFAKEFKTMTDSAIDVPTTGLVKKYVTDSIEANKEIDDSVINTEKTHSSEHIYNLACAKFTESGTLVSCYPVKDFPLRLYTTIAKPNQPGVGVPSPNNPRPIIELSSCTVTDSKKNLVDIRNLPIASGKSVPVRVRAGTYIASAVDAATERPAGFTPVTYFTASFKDAEGQKVVGNIEKGVSLTASEASRITSFSVYVNNLYTGPAKSYSVQLEFGDTVTTFERYNAKTKIATFPSNSYAGVIDWQKSLFSKKYGVAKKTATDFKNVSNKFYESAVEGVYVYGVSFSKEQYCDIARIGNPDSTLHDTDIDLMAGVYTLDEKTTKLRISNALYKAIQASGQTLTMVYEIKTKSYVGVEISGELTAHEGINNIWADIGTMGVSGPEDPTYTKKQIVSKLDEHSQSIYTNYTNINKLNDVTVHHSAQVLTAAQKEQAHANINAMEKPLIPSVYGEFARSDGKGGLFFSTIANAEGVHY